MPKVKIDVSKLEELGRSYFGNLAAVKAKHPRRKLLALPGTAAGYNKKFPDSARRMLEALQRGNGMGSFFADADAAYTASSTGFNFNTINRMLRNGTLPPSARLDNYRKIIAKQMMQMGCRNDRRELYRGLKAGFLTGTGVLQKACRRADCKSAHYEPSDASETFRDSGIISTSTERGSAEGFAGTGGILLVITTIPGYRGYQPQSSHTNEHEYILAPQTQFQITEVKKITTGKNKKYYEVKVNASF